MTTRTREIHLASRPVGKPTLDNFRTVEVDLPDLDDGQILVRNTIMSVDPYMRGRMNDVKSYVPPFQVDQPLDGGAVGTVIASRSEGILEGMHVVHQLGWREHAVLDASDARAIDVDIAPASAYLGVLGMTGLTAYAGLTASTSTTTTSGETTWRPPSTTSTPMVAWPCVGRSPSTTPSSRRVPRAIWGWPSASG